MVMMRFIIGGLNPRATSFLFDPFQACFYSRIGQCHYQKSSRPSDIFADNLDSF